MRAPALVALVGLCIMAAGLGWATTPAVGLVLFGGGLILGAWLLTPVKPEPEQRGGKLRP